MKKTITLIAVIVAALVGFILIQKDDADYIDNHKIEKRVGATIFPLANIAEEIAGDEFKVVLMLSPGASPHTFDPQPSLLKDLQNSSAVFAVGHGLDNWATPLAASIGAPVITLDKNIELRASIDEHDEHDEHD